MLRGDGGIIPTAHDSDPHAQKNGSMASFAHDTRPGADRQSHRSAPGWSMVLAVILPLACLAATFAAMHWPWPPFQSGRRVEDVISGVVFDAWNFSPHLGLMALLVVIARRWPRGLGVAMVLSLGYTAFTTWCLYDFVNSDSSTAAIIFVFIPIVLWGGVVTVGALTWTIGFIAGRRGRSLVSRT